MVAGVGHSGTAADLKCSEDERERIMRWLFGILCVCIPAVEAIGHDHREAQRPNFVFIMADDLGWADVAFHGGRFATPHLDRLASRNLELGQHYVAPVCSPTRTGLMTGRCWSRFGITAPTNTQALPFGTPTLPGVLRSAGYATCLMGKWHLGSSPETGPNHFGFDHSYGSLAGGISPWNHRYKKGPWTETWHRDETLIEESGHVTDLLTTAAEKWIAARDEQPFFLYLPYTAVHLPLKEPAEWLQRVPAEVTGEVPRHYAASVMHLDDAVGRILHALERKGLRQSTLVVFTSDNGGSTAENNDLKYPDDNCPNGRLIGNNLPLRGIKGDVYEGGIRVPTMVSWPGKIEAGHVSDPVQITDWMPTLCALAGITPATDLRWDGTDLSDLLLNKTPLAERSLYTAGPGWRASALRRGEWKLVVSGSSENPRHELFRIAKDTGEQHDLAKQEPAQLQRMLQFLKQVQQADRDSVVRR